MKPQKNILTDTFGRHHDYLRISLTERCNLRCVYCMPEEGIPLRDKSHFMTIEEIYAIARTFVDLGVKKIRLTGGEPLVRKGVDHLLKLLTTLGVELSITTNGILVDRFISAFKEANIKTVNVSLDSLDRANQKQLSRRDYLDKILQNIDLLIREGFKVKLNMVVMKNRNDHEINDFIMLTKEKPVDVRFIEFMPFNGNKWEWEEKGVGMREILAQVKNHFGENVEKIADSPNDTTRHYKVKGHQGNFGVISTVSNPFCSTCNRIRLTADGKVKNCLFSGDETDILTPYRSGEAIEKIIFEALQKKLKVRAGMEKFEDLFDKEKIEQNRSMIAIGG